MAKKRSKSRRANSEKKFPQTTRAGFVGAGITEKSLPDYVVAELKYESPVVFTTSRFTAPAAAAPEAAGLNKTLERFDVAKLRSQFGLKSKEIRARIDVASSLTEAPTSAAVMKKGADSSFFQSGFVQVVPKDGRDAKKIAAALERNSAVYEAYVAPRPVPSVPTGSKRGSRNFEPAQGYLYDPPDGIGAAGVWKTAGAKGEKITVCDIEGNWNRKHEDLPRGIKLLGGTVINDIGWKNHGTAVLGEIVSVSDSKGCVGIAHKASAAVHSAVVGGVFNTAGAINNAASKLKAGDVILIELQATGPNQKYVAMQYWPDIFSAIVAATNKGITVVEAAGNGNENFDLPIFSNTGLQKDSGAIVVGAGIPPANYFDIDNSYNLIGVPRSRIWFSNYGKIVNVQAWGYHVTTLGYGDLQGGSQNRWYTLRFSGTSSASPIVTGAVACLQGRSKVKNGGPLTPARIRQILIRTGTPQVKGPGVPLSQHIGPQPNLLKAIRLV
ncbi:MAG: S8 family serine peptidase [Acidobacteriota bacterium]|nr:S8 family serine peptidase [Acidobacteriota bacterium]